MPYLAASGRVSSRVDIATSSTRAGAGASDRCRSELRRMCYLRPPARVTSYSMSTMRAPAGVRYPDRQGGARGGFASPTLHVEYGLPARRAPYYNPRRQPGVGGGTPSVPDLPPSPLGGGILPPSGFYCPDRFRRGGGFVRFMPPRNGARGQEIPNLFYVARHPMLMHGVILGRPSG